MIRIKRRRPRIQSYPERLSISLTSKQAEKLYNLADTRETSVSRVIRDLIDHYLDKLAKRDMGKAPKGWRRLEAF